MTVIPQCFDCKHLHAGRPTTGPMSCDAFPGGIPKEILQGADHTRPFPGDKGIRYEPIGKGGP